ncbi:MAG: hypothetical protein ACLFRP_01115 [Puniceicoccaceae bacterium]
MNLEPSQKSALAQWVADGDSLPTIQEKLSSEFGIKLTFMETRFLVEDLDLDLVDSTPPSEEAGAAEPDTGSGDEPVDLEDAGFDGGAGAGRVSVEIDKLTRPGAVVSGSVVFSDGKTATWLLDQMGQLRLMPAQEGYQPGDDDIQAFQTALQNELRKQGF